MIISRMKGNHEILEVERAYLHSSLRYHITLLKRPSNKKPFCYFPGKKHVYTLFEVWMEDIVKAACSFNL